MFRILNFRDINKGKHPVEDVSGFEGFDRLLNVALNLPKDHDRAKKFYLPAATDCQTVEDILQGVKQEKRTVFVK